jgi:cytochrome c biogenesis protein
VSATDSAAPPRKDPELPRPPRAAEHGALAFVTGSVRMAWRWLTRMRTALRLLAVLALMSAVATVVPQEPNVPATVAAWLDGSEGPGATVARGLDAIGAFDVYGSTAFLALLLLLYLSLTACLVPRIRAWLRLVRSSRPPLSIGPASGDPSAILVTGRAPGEVLDRAAEVLGPRWRQRRDGDRQLAAETGLWSREGGSLAFHLSFYALLAAIVIGQLVTFEGQRGVVEGEPGFTDTAVAYWSARPGRWFGEEDHAGWRLDLQRFEVDWIRDPLAPGAGQPTLFRSEVVVTSADGTITEAVVEGNRPLVVDGRKIHQLDWGYAPRVVVEVDGVVVHDAFLFTEVTSAGWFRGAIKVPGVEPELGLELFLYPFAPDSPDGPVFTGAPWDAAPLLLYRQWRGDLRLSETQQTLNRLDTSALVSEGGAYLRPGERVELEGVVVELPELRRWVGLQVSSRPQVPALLAASGLLVLGLVTALYASRRRLWVLVTEEPGTGRTLVTVTGHAFQRPEAFTDEHARLVAGLGVALGDVGAGDQDATGLAGRTRRPGGAG